MSVRAKTGAVVASAAVALAASAALSRADEDVLIADFEGRDYGEWKATGEAFGPGPARGTLAGQMKVTGYKGKGLVNSFCKGDGTTGTLTSPPFKIQRRYLCFLIGGGGYAGTTCMNLLAGGKIARTATGPNTRPGGSERLEWHCWDVGDLAGRQAVLQIVDRRTGGWGHINVDHIMQTDRKRKKPGRATRQITIDKRYLHLPVQNGAAKCRMKVTVAGRIVDEFDIELAPDEPDLWVFLDVGPYAGKRATIAVDRLPEDSKGLAAVRQADEVPGAKTMYKEKYRPQFHFSSRRGWNNDPNGLVYSKGEYHLFYQHNPYGWRWGNMHWGHAVSEDLVHWRELPVAIYPHRYGDWVFSGSAVVDVHDTAGFKAGEEDVIVAAYTSTGRGEAIAYSNDRGRTFTDYEHNPVVKHSGRDPKVIWYTPPGSPPLVQGKAPGHWVMAVYDQQGKSRGIAFYTSPDLKHWTFRSRIDGYYECPEIFELPVDGDRSRTKWVVYAADGSYAVGEFDGRTFTPDHKDKHRFNRGNCFYASQTFNNTPPADGRRIQIAWGRVGHKEMPFNQMMNFPVELTLRTTEQGVRMFAEPVKEIRRLHRKKHTFENVTLTDGGRNPLAGVTGDLFHIVAEFAVGKAREFGLTIRGVPVAYNVEKAQLACRRLRAPLKAADGRIRLEVLVDRMSIEVFANAGRVYVPIGVIPPDGDRTLGVFTKGGRTKAASLTVYELRSAWR